MVLVNKEHMFKKFYIIDFSWKSWISDAVKVASQSHWSHTGIILDVSDDKVTLLESLTPGGPTVTYYTKEFLYGLYKNKTIEILNFGLKNDNSDEILAKYKNQRITYGYESILAILLIKLGFSTKFNIVGTMICSELVSRLIYDLSDGKIALGYNPGAEDKNSEYDIEFWRIEPSHISLSKYGDRVRVLE